MEFIFGLLLVTSIPLLFLYFIHQLDFYQSGQFQTIVLSLVLGGIAFTIAAITNWSLEYLVPIDIETIERFIAPILEEIFKGLFLLYLIKRSQFTYSVDGILYGLAVGIGFAVLENIFYITQVSNATDIAFQRIFTASLVHAFSSAVLGMALATLRSGSSFMRWLVPLVGLFLAIAQHGLYNNAIHSNYLIDNAIHPAVIYIPGIIGGVFIYGVMQYGKKQAQKWIKEKLGMEDRITRNEVAAVNSLATTDEFLLPIIERFGVEKADQVEELLYLQARIGIKRKSLDSIQNNETIHNAVEIEINEMRAQMEKVQRGIGVYAMLFVRGLFTDEMISVWNRIQAKIRERSAATGGQKGGGLWSSLEERVK
jgi:RsiW-degrading membrane proteinase PrsW (M82 family)